MIRRKLKKISKYEMWFSFYIFKFTINIMLMGIICNGSNLKPTMVLQDQSTSKQQIEAGPFSDQVTSIK